MRLPRWKREQRERRFKKLVIFLRLVILVFLLMSFGGITVLLGRQWQSSPLPKEGRATIVLASKPLLVLSFEPGGNLTFVSIPENTYVEVPQGFGSYRIGATWELGNQEKMEGNLLAQTTQEFLGVPVDGWMGMTNDKWQMANGKDNILRLKNNLTSWKIFLKPRELLETLKNLRTNLTIFDLAWVWVTVKFTRFDKIQFVDLGETSALSTFVLADGSQAKTADQGLLDSVLAGLFKESKFVNERLLVEVLNGTDKPGLANRVARLITNLGGSLVSVGNSQEKMNTCRIRGENKALQTFTSQRLAQIYHCQKEADKRDSRADIQIIIGEDYWQRLFSTKF